MIITLIPGKYITTTRELASDRIERFKFAQECTFKGGLMPGAHLKVVEVNKIAGDMWVKAELPFTDPLAVLKIAGEEFSIYFKPV